MKKKIAVCIAAAVTALSCTAFTACGDDGKENYSETYTGTLSTESYATADDAAQAFVENEVTSSSTPVTYKSYTKQKDLTEEEIAKLNLTEAQIADVERAEKGVISFTYDPTTGGGYTPASSSAASAEEGKKVVYCVKFNTPEAGGAYKYLSPLPENGERLSKSYYMSVLDPELYRNCTMIFEMPVTVKVSSGWYSYTTTASIKYTAKITDAAIEMLVTAKLPDDEVVGKYNTTTVSMFLMDSPNGYGIMAAIFGDGYWKTANFTDESGIESIEEMWTYNMPDAEFTYLEKTNYGFKLGDEYLAGLFDELIKEAGFDFAVNGDFSASANYYVKEGKLDRVSVVCKMAMKVIEEGTSAKIDVTVKVSNKYRDVGTTVVNVPEDAKLAMGIVK